MAKKPKTSPSPYVTQAQQLDLVRYGPERSALVALLQQAAETRDTAISSARSTSDLVRSAVDQARPSVQQAYQQAMGTAAQQQAIAAPQLTAGSPFAQAAALESSGLNSRLAESQAAESTSLTNRRIAAAEGAAYAGTSANRQYAQDVGKVNQRALDLANEEGAFTSSTAMQLGEDDAKAGAQADQAQARIDQQERDSQRSSGIDPDTGAPIPGGKLDPKTNGTKKRWATSAQQSAASDTIQGALNEANTLKQGGAARHEVADLLLNGADDQKPQPVYETVKVGNRTVQRKKLNKDGTPVMTKPVPGITPVKSQLLLSAALDMAYDGHLSRRNQKLLHDRGIKLAPLGLVTYEQWKQQNPTERAQQRVTLPSGRTITG